MEVELELLGLQGMRQGKRDLCCYFHCTESVELLAGVAELTVDSVPPICLEIAQLVKKSTLITSISNVVCHSAAGCLFGTSSESEMQ